MNSNSIKFVKLEIYAPPESLADIVEAFSQAGAGEFGNYDHVYTTSNVSGHWRPLAGSHPTVGTVGEDETAEELKIEVNCRQEIAHLVKKAIQAVHPYETPVINIIPLANDHIEDS